jgi:transposase InsO family protein
MENSNREKPQDKKEHTEGEVPAAEGGRSPSGAAGTGAVSGEGLEHLARFRAEQQGKALQKNREDKLRAKHLTPGQRLLILDTWQRSGLTARDFGAMVGLARQTLYSWKKRFERSGPEGLIDDRPVRRPQSTLSEITRRAILMLKESHPEYGCQRISDILYRMEGMEASATTVSKVLHEEGYELSEEAPRSHRTPESPKRFERSRPNELWQTDIFQFTLKRQNRRVYLCVYMDDYSRYIVSYALGASQSNALVLEGLRSGIASYQCPTELLTDNGAQYHTWRGKSAFAKECEKQGIKQIVSRPRHPETLGKVERFWKTLWNECVQTAVFTDMEDARQRIGLYIGHYNFQRTHQGIEGLVPADRFFGAADKVKETLRSRVAENSLELAREGKGKEPFYLTGVMQGKQVSVHRKGERYVMKREGEESVEVEVQVPAGVQESQTQEPGLGESSLDQGLKKIDTMLKTEYNKDKEDTDDRKA